MFFAFWMMLSLPAQTGPQFEVPIIISPHVRGRVTADQLKSIRDHLRATLPASDLRGARVRVDFGGAQLGVRASVVLPSVEAEDSKTIVIERRLIMTTPAWRVGAAPDRASARRIHWTVSRRFAVRHVLVIGEDRAEFSVSSKTSYDDAAHVLRLVHRGKMISRLCDPEGEDLPGARLPPPQPVFERIRSVSKTGPGRFIVTSDASNSPWARSEDRFECDLREDGLYLRSVEHVVY